MGTTLTEVYDNFMMIIKDYRLVALYTSSATDFSNYLEGFLVSAITDFTICDQSLAYATGAFTATLTQKNISLLAKLMKKYWLEKEVADITQMSLHITDRDYKVYSEAQNMIAKQKQLILEREEISQMLTGYSLNNSVDWAGWYNGTFYTP
jgi:hypothetical protein